MVSSGTHITPLMMEALTSWASLDNILLRCETKGHKTFLCFPTHAVTLFYRAKVWWFFTPSRMHYYSEKKDENFVSNKLMRVRRANRRKVSFVLFQWWKFDRYQLACYQILFCHFAIDAAPHCLQKQNFSLFGLRTKLSNLDICCSVSRLDCNYPQTLLFGIGGGGVVNDI